MLNLLKKLSELRAIVFSVLILPIPFLLWNFTGIFNFLPDYPYPKFTVAFKVSGMMAREIEKKVVAPSEKMFNGLPGLLLMESFTEHELGVIELEFLSSEDSDRTLLFIQEKLDRLRVRFPSNVEEVTVNLRKREDRPHLIVDLPEDLLAYQWNELLNKLGPRVIRSGPYIEKYQSLGIKINIIKIRELGLSLNEVGNALKVAGLTYRLGRESGVSYLLEGTYKTKADIENILVGIKGHRPLRLGDIANVQLILPKAPKSVKLWIDQQLFSKKEVKALIESKIQGSFVKDPLSSDLIAFIFPNIMVALGMLIIQAIVFYLTFKNWMAVSTVIVFSLFWMGEFSFIKWMSSGEFTHLDFASLYIGNIIVVYLWYFLLCRIRTYFLRSSLDNFIQRELQQAVFFSLVEYVPTFFFLYVLLGVLSLPILLNDLNIISKEIISTTLTFSPLALILLVVMAIFSNLEWIKNQKHLKTSFFKGALVKRAQAWCVVPILGIALTLPFLWDKFPLGISGGNFLKEWRGIGKQLVYYTSPQNAKEQEKFKINIQDNIHLGPIVNWEITPSGLNAIAGRDINSFQMTLQDLIHRKEILSYEGKKNDMVIHYDSSFKERREFGELNLGGKNKTAIPLRIFSRPRITLMEDHIFRGQLNRRSKITFDDSVTKKNIFHKVNDANFLASSKTRHFFKEYEYYLKGHWTVLLFLFVILSLFLNSFTRGGLLCILAMSIWKLHEALGMALGSTFNLDSLWISPIPLWVGLSIILLLSKVADLERLRGNDRDIVLDELDSKMGRSTVYGILLFIFSILWWWFANHMIATSQYFNYSHELLGISLSMVIIGVLTFFLFFRLYYVTSESVIENIRFKIYAWYYKK